MPNRPEQRRLILLSALFACLSSPLVLADDLKAETHFDILPQSLDSALLEFSDQADVQLMVAANSLEGIETRGVSGELSAEEALSALLEETGLEYDTVGTTVTVKSAASGEDATPGKARPAPVQPMVAQTATPAARATERQAANETTETTSPDEKHPEEIIVTGSRIERRVDIAGPNPVLTISSERIERSGAATLTEFTRKILPIQTASVTDSTVTGNVGTGQSNINLRGLGNGSTLVLVNGRRFALSGNSRIQGGNINNINTIPVAAVERIEILKDGASAIYGSDAIAGVVNIILRKDFDGFEANLSYGNTFDTDSAITSGSLTAGFSGERGNSMITLAAYNQNGMMGGDRDFSASADQRPLGGTDQRTTPGVQGTVFALPGQVLPGVFLPNGSPATFAAIPSGQNGVGLTPADFAATAGVHNLINQNEFMSIVPERKTVNLVATFNYRFTDDLELFGRSSFSHIDSFNYIYNVQVRRGQLVIPASNPFNPFGVDVYVEKNMATEFAGGVRGNDYDDFSVVAGLRGGLFDSWDWEAAYTYSQSNSTNDFNPVNLNKAGANAALTDPASAYNWFGDPAAMSVNSASQIAAVQGFESGMGKGTLTIFDASVSGDLFSFGDNTVKAVLGAAYRKDHYEQAYISDSRPAATNTFTGIIQQQDRKVISVFGEMSVPLIGPQQNVPLAYSLELSLAGRHEDLDTFGTTADPRIGVRWQPIRSLLLRATYGTSFRAPTADQVGSNPSEFCGRVVVDPKRGNTQYPVCTLENRALGLEPETSENFSAGFVFEPPFASGLTLSAGYYRIEYNDKFSYLFPDVAAQFEDGAFGSRITRGAPSAQDIAMGWAGPITQIVLGYVNLASTEVSGVDFEANYVWETSIGQFNYRLLGTTTLQYDEVTVPGGLVVQREGTYRFPKKLQGNTSLFWSRDRWAAGVTLRYIDSYMWDGSGTFNSAVKIDALTEVDLQTSYRFESGTHVTFGVNNIMNEDPPFFPGALTYIGNFGYNTALTSPRKATYYINLKQQF